MNFIDTHAHIHMMPEDVRANVMMRASEAGVHKIVNVACNLKQVRECLDLVNGRKGFWTTAGIHPTDLTGDLEVSLAEVGRLASTEEKVVAIGEIGLDYYHDKFPHDVQEAFLKGQLEIANRLNLPAIIHCRAGKNPGENESAFVDLIRILTELNFTNGVVHCFSGNSIEAEKLVDMGLMLSFTGIVTYPNNETLREIVKQTPLDRIMIETDAPFLTPDAHRGKPNEPAFVVEVAKIIADVKNVPLQEVARMTSANAERFFNLY